jgi:hypothetical protein
VPVIEEATMRTHFVFVDPDWRSPAQRPNRADMSRTAFLRLVVRWSAGVSGLLLIPLLAQLVS